MPESLTLQEVGVGSILVSALEHQAGAGGPFPGFPTAPPAGHLCHRTQVSSDDACVETGVLLAPPRLASPASLMLSNSGAS